MRLSKYGNVWANENLIVVAAERVEPPDWIWLYSHNLEHLVRGEDALRLRKSLDAMCGEPLPTVQQMNAPYIHALEDLEKLVDIAKYALEKEGFMNIVRALARVQAEKGGR